MPSTSRSQSEVGPDPTLRAVADGVAARLTHTRWDGPGASVEAADDPQIAAAAEVAVFALELAGKRRQARRDGRFGRLVVRFALAACVALATVTAACDKPDATPEQTQVALSELPSVGGAAVSITAQPRASPGLFTDLTLLDAGSDTQAWAVLQAPGTESPILVDRIGAGLDDVGGVYQLAAQPLMVGTRDGPSQFLDPLEPAVASGGSALQPQTATARQQVEQQWAQDERYLAPTRAILGQPSVLDAAYNAAAAAAAGGTHTYLNGVVLRVEPDKPVLEVIDQALLQSGLPTRAEDVVYVAIRSSEQSLYEPGQVVNLRDVVMNQQQTDVNGQSTTVYVANAALDGARVEPTGNVDLQGLLQPRLQRVDQDLAAEDQVTPTAGTPTATAATATPVPAAAAAQPTPIVIRERSGPSFVDDFLIWMWLSNSGFYRGSTVVINNPPPAPTRPTGSDVYYSPPPQPSSSAPSTVSSAQAASRSTALAASRTSVSGQTSGTGGGVAATNKSASAASDQAGAVTAKAASVASDVSTSSAGKSVAAAPSSSSSTASRSAGSTSAGTRGSAGISSSSSSEGASSSASKGVSGGFGGKGISGTGGSA